MRQKILFFFVLLSIAAQSQIAEVYITGGSVGGYEDQYLRKMSKVKSDQVFYWSGYLNAGLFKFQPVYQSNTQNNINAIGEDVAVSSSGGTFDIQHNSNGGNGDYKFSLQEAGGYRIKVDLNTMQMTIDARKSLNELLTDDELWIVGSAIPGGQRKLKLDKKGLTGLKYYWGELQTGDFKIMTTPSENETTKYIVPDFSVSQDGDASAYSPVKLSTDSNDKGWEVNTPSYYYKLFIDLNEAAFFSSIYPNENYWSRPGNHQLYIVGGATEVGWSPSDASELARDENNPAVFVFNGLLGDGLGGQTEPRTFKILTGRNWNDCIHPRTPNEPVLGSSECIKSWGGDNKWIVEEGSLDNYRITVDLFGENFSAVIDNDMIEVVTLTGTALQDEVIPLNQISKEVFTYVGNLSAGSLKIKAYAKEDRETPVYYTMGESGELIVGDADSGIEIVDADPEKAYYLKIDFGKNKIKLTAVSNLKLIRAYYGGNDNFCFLQYAGESEFKTVIEEMQFPNASWGVERRYKFKMDLEDGSSVYYGSKGDDKSTLFEVSSDQYSNTFALSEAADNKRMEVKVLFPSTAYTHVLRGPSKIERTFYIDLGQDNPNQGMHLTDRDEGGNYWNNVIAPNGAPSTLTAGASIALRSSENIETSYTLEVARDILSNGGAGAGGLLTPDAALLGDLAVSSATEDYFFLGNGMGKGLFYFKNLDTSKSYKFYIYGCRTAAGDQRGILYSLSGKNGSHGRQLSTGTGIGEGGYDGNNNNVWQSTPITPTSDGEIMLELGRLFDNQMAYISALKIEEYSGLAEPTVDRKFFIDLGKNNNGLDGAPTLSPDVNGNSWNNIYSNGDGPSTGASDGSNLLSMIASDNTSTDYTVELTSTVRFNGVRNGALGGSDSPDEPTISLLGELAVKTATYDYLYLEGSQQAIFQFKNLDYKKQYRFYILGSRTDSGKEGRVARIELRGTNSSIGIHQMGGAGIGANGENYNNKNVFISDPIIPDAGGNISLTMSRWLGFAHMNCIKIEEIDGGVPSIATAISILGGRDIASCGGILQLGVNTSPKDALLPLVVWSVTDEDIAYISETGRLYAKSNGTVEVTATATLDDGTILTASKEITVSGQDIPEYSFTVMGSSVPWGQGANPRDKNGYAWLWMTHLSEQAENNWVCNNTSIGGNTTTDVLNRWDNDLLPSCSRYVYYGLSLGNEGIHERGEAAFNSWRDNMLRLIERTENLGKTAIVGNNYPRADFNETDYAYLKELNLLIHEWNVASVNLLGAIDNGAGQWASGYMADNAHPNTTGHAEMFYAIVPSLLDAMSAKKPQPIRDRDTYLSFDNGSSLKKCVALTPEGTLHSFTFSFDFKTDNVGTLASLVDVSGDTVRLSLNSQGYLEYGSYTSSAALNEDAWHSISLSHYYAQGKTYLYIDGQAATDVSVADEKLTPVKFMLNDLKEAPQSASYRELFLFRAGMCEEEIAALHSGKMLKSSLEIYAPLDGVAETVSEALRNLAQSLNSLAFEEETASSLDELKNDLLNGDEIKELSVYSVLGQKLLDASRWSEVERMSPGLYIVRMQTKSGRVISQKVNVK